MALISFFRKLTALLAAAISLALLSPMASAQKSDNGEFRYDMILLRRLLDNSILDFAELQLEAMKKLYPEEKDAIAIEEANLHYAKGSRTKGDEVLKSIGSGSSQFRRAQMMMAMNSFRARRFEQAAKAFEDYFASTKPPVDGDEDEQNEYKKAIAACAQAYTELGQAEKAQNILKKLGELQKEGEGGDAARQLVLLNSRTVLNIEEAKDAGRQPVNTEAVKKALEELDKLQWVLDGITAAAIPEMARANILLGDFDKAIATLQTSAEFLHNVDKNVRRDLRRPELSPLGPTFFYYGVALKKRAEAAFRKKDMAEAESNLTKAAGQFMKVIRNYGEVEEVKRKSFAEYGRCAELLKQYFNKILPSAGDDSDGVIASNLEQGSALFAADNYEGAIPPLLRALQAGRLNKKALPAGLRLVFSFAKLGRYLEAEAIAQYMADVFPDEFEAGDSLLKLGAIIYQKSREEKVPAVKEEFKIQAMNLWDRFVDLSPAHPQASDTAFMIAEDKYDIAQKAADAAKKLPPGKEREQATKLAMELFKAAIPAYQRMVSQFSAFEKGVRAIYKLGWIYYLTEQPAEAINHFLQYAETENRGKWVNDRLEAKFRAIELLVTNKRAQEAIDLIIDLQKLVEPKNAWGVDPNSDKAKLMRELSVQYLGYAYDLTGESLRPQISSFDARARRARAAMREAEDALKVFEKQRDNAKNEKQAAEKEFNGHQEEFRQEPEDRFKPVAAPGGPSAAELAAMKPEDRAREEKIAQENAAKMVGQAAKQIRDELTGEKMNYENQLAEILTNRKSMEKRRQFLEKELVDARAFNDKKAAQVKTYEENIAVLTKELAEISENFNKAEKAFQDLTNATELLRNALNETTDPKKADEIRAAGRLAVQKLEEAKVNLEKAKKISEDPETGKKQQRLDAALPDIENLREELQQAADALRKLEQDQKLNAKEIALLEAREKAVNSVLALNAARRKRFDLPANSPDKEAMGAEITKLKEEVMAAFATVKEKRREVSAVNEEIAKHEISLAQQKLSLAQENLKAIDAEKQPVVEAFNNWKLQAIKPFVQFIEKFPEAKNLPDIMGRLGALYLELGDAPNASKYLQELAAKFPNAPAAKRALFDLGRVECDLGNYAKAADPFGKLVQDPKVDISSANLVFISEQMLANNFPRVSLDASRILLARSEDQTRSDYDMLRRLARDSALFRAGSASLLLEDYEQAVMHLSKLLEEKPNTAFFFEAKEKLAEARARKQPPDYDAAIRELGEMIPYAKDAVTVNKSLIRMGQIHELAGDQNNVSLALARYQQVVVLSDPENKENLPFIEEAIYRSAYAAALLGNTTIRDRMVAEYKEKFSRGKFRMEIDRLPAQKFASQPATPETTQTPAK